MEYLELVETDDFPFTISSIKTFSVVEFKVALIILKKITTTISKTSCYKKKNI